MSKFRTVLFWLHLASGIAAGVVIFIMCVTGALLSFERNIIEWSERDERYSEVRNETPLSPTQILKRVLEQRPELKPTALALPNEPGAAWQLSAEKAGIVFVDPYNGEITGGSNQAVRDVMSSLRSLHRWVALSGDQRPIGKAITGWSNILFAFLCISGLYIWIPRVWRWESFKPVMWFRGGLRGKARNFNWHNTIGLWSSVFLIIFTVTATVISFQWASDLLYTLTGNDVPQRSSQPTRGTGTEEAPFSVPHSLDAAFAKAREVAPEWRSISMRLPATDAGVVLTVDEGIYWNIFARSTLTVDAETATVTKWDPYGERNAAVQLRSWFRFTHTGETGGLLGQIIGFLACIGGAVLVWTGFSLALRRLANWRKRRANGVA